MASAWVGVGAQTTVRARTSHLTTAELWPEARGRRTTVRWRAPVSLAGHMAPLQRGAISRSNLVKLCWMSPAYRACASGHGVPRGDATPLIFPRTPLLPCHVTSRWMTPSSPLSSCFPSSLSSTSGGLQRRGRCTAGSATDRGGGVSEQWQEQCPGKHCRQVRPNSAGCTLSCSLAHTGSSALAEAYVV